MRRVVARVPESIEELCVVRMGLQARSFSAMRYAHRVRSAMARDAAGALSSNIGLLGSETFSMGLRHLGLIQYWRSFDDLEAWSRRPPHTEWWRAAVERMRSKGDLGIYHEAYLVPASRVESIYLDCDPVGLARFGILQEPVGPQTTGRGRLGRSSR